MNEHNYLSEHYGSYDEEGRLSSRHGQVEFLTTIRYIEKYLQKGMRILEVGAGTGAYSLYFAEHGYEVDAVELVEHNISILKSKQKPGHKLRTRQGNAIDLSCYEDHTFDITLVLGPMYHLFEAEDKHRALSEAIRVTRPGGVIFIAYCIHEGTIIMWGFQGDNIREAINKGMIDTENYRCLSEPSLIFEMHRREDIEALRAGFEVEPLHYVATDLATNFMRPTVDAMDDELFSIYLDYHFKMCERQDLVGATHHSLDIFRKR